MGIVLGSFGMVNSDMILFQAEGQNSTFHDVFSNQTDVMPVNDKVQNIAGTFQYLAGTDEVSFSVMRPLDSGD